MDILCCPDCRESLDLVEGSLRCRRCGVAYPIVDGIPRFVPAENYASSFGFQWNHFRQTQLDSYSGAPITKKRFFAQSGWKAEEMRGERVLDVGCGAGRFAEVTLATGARLVAVDSSNAVDACKQNLGENERFAVVQADLFRLPFREGVFDRVYCFGVLQHTPDPALAFRSLLAPLKRGGEIAADVYPRTWMNVLWPKYWLRPLTKRMRRDRLFALVQRMVPILLPISRLLGRVPKIGRKLRWLVPVANYEGIYPLNERQIKEWAVLDTFDMLSPAYDRPQPRAALREWIAKAGMRNGEVVREGHLVVRGEK